MDGAGPPNQALHHDRGRILDLRKRKGDAALRPLYFP